LAIIRTFIENYPHRFGLKNNAAKGIKKTPAKVTGVNKLP
jgi:hypothetical protein